VGEQAGALPGPQVFGEQARPARPDELARLPAIEDAADELFAHHGIGPLPPATTDVASLAGARAILVAGDPVTGFARLEEVDGSAHLEQLSVHPTQARRGVGTALLRASVDWAAAQGYRAVTLCTFADVPWNAPFYRRHGFSELTVMGSGVQELRATEGRLGLDLLGRRIVMHRPLR
jgi:GNAT superfamily N-acetyltransferase